MPIGNIRRSAKTRTRGTAFASVQIAEPAEHRASFLRSNVRQATAAEVRLDAGKSARFAASAQSIDRFDRLLRTRCAIYRLPSCPKGRLWPHNSRESGECRFKLQLGRNGRDAKESKNCEICGYCSCRWRLLDLVGCSEDNDDRF
jgi:hypothetical protein